MAVERVSIGAFAFEFEASSGALRGILVNGIEALRGVYVAVRDECWETIEPRIGTISRSQGEGTFSLGFQAHCRRGEIDFLWKGRVVCSESELSYEFEGESRSRFSYNRIGCCVLHPAELGGKECEVETVEGERRRLAFPDAISPWQPFTRLRAMRHRQANGSEVEVRFSGDVFETEDQRNWTDASFKTYSRPLDLPFPVVASEGERFSQRVVIRASPAASASPASGERAGPVRLIAHADQAKPVQTSLGLVATLGSRDGFDERTCELLGWLRGGHLRVELDLSEEDWERRARPACDLSEGLGAPIELAVFCPEGVPDTRLSALARWMEERARTPGVARVLVYDSRVEVTRGETVNRLRERLPESLSQIPVGGGSNAYFAEVNRDERDAPRFDALAYSVNPQVHAFDDRSLMETLPMQGETVRSARCRSKSQKVCVGPITLSPRFNPQAPPAGAVWGGETAKPDPRLATAIGAVWTLGSLKYLLESGAYAASYHGIFGSQGVVGSGGREARPRLNAAGEAMAEILGFAAEEVVPVASSDPRRAIGLLLRRGELERLWLANLAAEPLVADLSRMGFALGGVGSRIPLGAYSWKRFDLNLI